METKRCAICDKEITRPPSHFKSKNTFCSRKHKEKGMVLGLVAPMRLGTGYGAENLLPLVEFMLQEPSDLLSSLDTKKLT